MRVHRAVPMLAAVLTLAGGTAPNALAFDAEAPAAGPSAPVSHNSSDASDWLIGAGAAGGITVFTAALAVNRRSRRGVARAGRVGAAGRL